MLPTPGLPHDRHNLHRLLGVRVLERITVGARDRSGKDSDGRHYVPDKTGFLRPEERPDALCDHSVATRARIESHGSGHRAPSRVAAVA